ncbi:unnamed protein product, partial [marine sediment metagenome]
FFHLHIINVDLNKFQRLSKVLSGTQYTRSLETV